MTIEEKILQIKEEIRTTPYHKGTEHHIGKLRAKLAKLKRKLEEKRAKSKGLGFAVKKEGDATAVLVGPPSVGKSTLLNKLTHATSKVGAYNFTTTNVIPGMLVYKGAKIQILDLPGLISGGTAKSIGRGKEILSVVKNANLLMLTVDVKSAALLPKIKKGLAAAGINKNLPLLTLINKIDLLNIGVETCHGMSLQKLKDKEAIPISAKTGEGLEALKEAIFQKLKLLRVFLKPKNREVDFENPLILKKGAIVFDAASKISSELAKNVKSARVWGPSAKFPGQYVSLSHKLSDADILTLLKGL